MDEGNPMKDFKDQERRKFPRVKYQCFLKLENIESDEDVVLLTRIDNICLGGIMVIIKQDLEVGRIINLSLDLLASEQNLRCKGVISWCKQRAANEEKKPLFYEIGIEFVDLSDEDTLMIEGIVNRK